MKKLLMSAAIAVLAFSQVNAQELDGNQTSKGKWLIEVNTGFSGAGQLSLYQHTANTSFGLNSIEGTTIWSVGTEGGYFVMDDLAVKAGLGYTDYDGTSIFSYKLGAKYYVISQIPVQVDLSGASIQDEDDNPLWLGLQGGYAFFLGKNVSIEPGIRYSVSLNEEVTDEGIFEARIGFALHF
ncbi:hypothetical protein J1D01_16140 [Seonamhaeicola sp. NFXS20]|uniref:hypothetical protein n=1 Tax=Seonamhaeicola sp. NFXS20 TaxID=2816959 RepID=UPI003B8E0866